MAFDLINQAAVAFKNLLGKSHTDDKGIGEEAEGSFFNVGADTIFTSTIDPNPAVAVSANIAIAVTATMAEDPLSNHHAFFTYWPSSPPSGHTYGSGYLAGISAGDRIKNIIPPSYNYRYEAKPKDASSNVISPGDPSDWVYQYQSGIYYRQDLSSPPATMDLYYYSGEYLTTALTITSKYITTITGDGSTTDFPINHAINNDVNVTITAVATGYEVETGITFTDANNCTIVFNIAPINNEQFKIVII